MVILSENKTNMCLMTHRPLKKVTRSPWVLLTGVLVFTLICFVFYYGMRGRRDFLPTLHDKLYLTSYILVGLITPTYLLAVSLNPGRLARRFDFLYLVDTLLEKGLHLDNVCVYDEILKSETSFHCQICNRCVELFDHHCPFINNCLGSNNHKYFLIFLASYVCFFARVDDWSDETHDRRALKWHNSESPRLFMATCTCGSDRVERTSCRILAGISSEEYLPQNDPNQSWLLTSKQEWPEQ